MHSIQTTETDRDRVLEKLAETIGDRAEAERWLAKYALPSFGGMTALEIIGAGHTTALLEYIDGMFSGTYA